MKRLLSVLVATALAGSASLIARDDDDDDR
jgi:hypothetical protein